MKTKQWFIKTSLFALFLSVHSIDVWAESADYVFENAKAYTLNPDNPWVEAVAISGSTIAYAGDRQGLDKFISAKTRVIDLKGKMLLPGFIDTHSHPIFAAAVAHGFSLPGDGTVADWLRVVEEYAKDNPQRKVIYGQGFTAATFGPDGPTRELLDRIVPDRPVVLMDEGAHSAWVNSKALELAGINKLTPDPVPGTHVYKRDKRGELTGWCLEAMTFMPMMERLGVLSEETLVAGADEVFSVFSQFGITTVYDAGFFQFEHFSYPALDRLAKNDQLPFRIVTSNMIQSPDHVENAIEILTSYQRDYSSDLVRPRVMKIQNDGTKEIFTAAQFDEYVNQPGNKGSVLLGGEVLQAFVVDIDKAGFDIHIHAIGDRAVDEALDAFERVRKVNPKSESRYSIGHVELVRDQDLERFAELNVVAQTTPYWFATDGIAEVKAIGELRASKLYRFKTIIESGGRVTFGSDFYGPVSGDYFGTSPLPNIEMGMTRQYYGEKDMPVTPPENARLTLEELIRGYTLDAAYQLNMETEIGSIEEGKLADLIVIDKNLFDLDAYEIHKAKVELTMMNGRIVHYRID
jgi:predicted amidohydrolase YtcJ